MKGIVILFCIAGLLLAVTPANSAGEKKTEQTPVLQQSSDQSKDNGKTVAPVEVKKKEVTTQPSYSPEKATPPSPEPSPVNRDYTAPVVQSYFNYNSSNQGGESHPGSGGGNEAEHGHGGWSPGWNDHPRGGRHDHEHHGWNDPWRPWYWHHHWDFWMGPVFVPYPVFVSDPDGSYRYGRGVYVRYSGEDGLGSDIAQSLRAQLSNHGLKTVYSADEARLELYIVSMDQDERNPGSVAAVSVTYIWMPGNRFITTQLLDVPSSDVADVADYLAGHALDMIDEYH